MFHKACIDNIHVSSFNLITNTWQYNTLYSDPPEIVSYALKLFKL